MVQEADSTEEEKFFVASMSDAYNILKNMEPISEVKVSNMELNRRWLSIDVEIFSIKSTLTFYNRILNSDRTSEFPLNAAEHMHSELKRSRLRALQKMPFKERVKTLIDLKYDVLDCRFALIKDIYGRYSG